MTRPTDTSAVPYQGKPLYAVPDDLVHLDVLNMSVTDERLWVPQSKDVWFRPLLFNTSQGYFVNLLRVRKSGILSRHRHAGPVHATTLKGRWHYLEHDWWAEEGSYAFEPPGDIHTLEVPEGVEEMITMFHVTGAYIYVDPQGKPEAVEDVFSKIDLARAHFEKVSPFLELLVIGADSQDRSGCRLCRPVHTLRDVSSSICTASDILLVIVGRLRQCITTIHPICTLVDIS
jgi:2,4'-dihydroxyacetophenone dioxygenase